MSNNILTQHELNHLMLNDSVNIVLVCSRYLDLIIVTHRTCLPCVNEHTIQLLCGPMESIASVAKTFYDTNCVQDIKTELGFLQWKSSGFFCSIKGLELPITMCVRALFLHVCETREKKKEFSFHGSAVGLILGLIVGQN